ncbi:unnamed protein product [Closterium sp. NIES-65]|nr:unnamed protein product [Closterium sp. NIES-65]
MAGTTALRLQVDAWQENIRDWCISRQLRWGHRIPAWYVTFNQSDKAAARDFPVREFGAYNTNWVVTRTDEDARRAGEKKFLGRKFELGRDPDVLNTWFSSGLFPFSAFGWPEETADFKTFYPTALLETGHDTLFFWVARMVFMGLRLTGQLPFKQVYLHAMWMNINLNIEQATASGAFANSQRQQAVVVRRLTQCSPTPSPPVSSPLPALSFLSSLAPPSSLLPPPSSLLPSVDEHQPGHSASARLPRLVQQAVDWMNINLDIQRVHGYRLWCNKLWNAIRFAMFNLGDSFTPPSVLPQPTSSDSSSSPALTPMLNFAFSAPLPLSCRWILSVLNVVVTRAVTALEGYDLAEATNAAYVWWQYQLCDVFIEVAKPAFNAAEGEEALKLKQVGGWLLPDREEALKLKQVTREVLWVCLDVGLRLLDPFMPFATKELWPFLSPHLHVGLSLPSTHAGLRLLHPFMPFVTEELWQCLPKPADYSWPSIMLAPYPSPVKVRKSSSHPLEESPARSMSVKSTHCTPSCHSSRRSFGSACPNPPTTRGPPSCSPPTPRPSRYAKQKNPFPLGQVSSLSLSLLHPFMPFITEELWQRLPKPADYSWLSIMLAPYPSPVKILSHTFTPIHAFAPLFMLLHPSSRLSTPLHHTSLTNRRRQS